MRVHHWLLPILLFLGLAGCQAPGAVQVRAQRNDMFFREIQENVLTVGQPSARTEQLLRVYNLDKRFRRDPLEVIAALDRQSRQLPDPDTVFALAELSFLTGKKMQRLNKKVAMSLYGATVAYSYFYLFDESVGTMPNEYDPRFRLACDLYNTALAKCLRLAQSQEVRLGDTIPLEFAEGSMDIKITRHGLLWDESAFDHFLFAHDYEVSGLNNQYSTFGLGVPLIAVREAPRAEQGEGKFYPPKHSYPVTAFLRMDCDIRGLRDGGYRKATLELYDPMRVQSTTVAGKEVPLESDLTTPLGYYLSEAKYEKFELTGLLRGERVQDRAGLYMLQPYEKGKIPVVMVHGIWSSPLAWMQMFNDLRGDPDIRDRYQFWFFMYPTGNPVLYSASLLRSSLKDVIQTVDPNGEDPAIRQMVLVGHSMGGLLSKMMVQDSQEELWQVVSKKPFNRIEADPADLAKIQQAFFFEKQPYVSRLIFIAVPHRGSEMSDGFIGRLSSRLISLPKGLIDTRNKLLASNPEAFASLHIGLPTSVDNLSPESPVIQAVGRLPIAPTVKYHSIIANAKETGDLRHSTDGVVPYSSSHINNAVSEFVVSAGHACQSHPLTVLEVRRILHEHLRDIKSQAPVRLADRLVYPLNVDPEKVPELTK